MNKPYNKEYVTFSIAPYCLAKLLLALHNSKINNYAITQEDNNLVVRIAIEELERIVYPINRNPQDYRNPQDCGCKGSE